MITEYNRLSGLQKVAILFSVLGESLAMNLVQDISKTTQIVKDWMDAPAPPEPVVEVPAPEESEDEKKKNKKKKKK